MESVDSLENKKETEIKMGSMNVSQFRYEGIKNDGEIKINDKIRKSIFYILCGVYCISCCDGGIIPQQNSNIQKDFEDEGNETRVGLFGSIDYIGRIIGAIIMSYLIDKMDRRLYLSGCCFLKGIISLVPLITPYYYPNIVARLLSGMPQTLLTSYGTIWTDQFGKRKNRALMVSLLQLGGLLGIIVGYGLGIICDLILKNSSISNKILPWRFCFVIEGVFLGILSLLIIAFPKIYFSKTFYLNTNDDFKGKEKPVTEIEKSKKHSHDIIGLLKQIPKIFCQKIFIFMSLGNTVAFFGMRVIQFYADKYMDLVLEVKKEIKFILYIFICLSGPVLGIIITSIIFTKIGGYSNKNGMILIIVLNLIACLISITISATLNPIISLGSAWLYLFCFAAVTPQQGGLIIVSLPKELKGNGFSINLFFLNCLGSFPSSYVFALICDYIRDNYPEQGNMRYRTTMRIIMLYNFVGLILIVMGGIYRFKIKGELDSSNNEKKEIEEKEEEENNNNTQID